MIRGNLPADEMEICFDTMFEDLAVRGSNDNA
jgi:hypothetical protein